ncbi:hypothetical protein ACLOJK_006888, partial [Asimina triloba]
MEPTIVDGFQSMQIRWSKLSKSETPKSNLEPPIARSRAARRQQHETHHAQISMDSKVGQRSSPIRLQIQKPSRTAGHERSRPIHTSRSPVPFEGENPFVASPPHRSSMAAFFPAAEPIIFFSTTSVQPFKTNRQQQARPIQQTQAGTHHEQPPDHPSDPNRPARSHPSQHAQAVQQHAQMVTIPSSRL